MPEVQKYSEVLGRVRSLQASKHASATETTQKGNPKGHMPSETDPADKGTIEVPKDDRGSEHLPSSRPELTDSITPGAATVPGGELNGAGPTGTDVPKTVDGRPKEEAATKPDTPLSKIAGDAKASANRILALRKKASAPATPVTPAKQAATADAGNDIQLDTAMLVKLANTILSTEEGVKLAEAQLVKAAGLEAARGILVAAQAQNEEYVKQAYAQAEWDKSAAAQEYRELQYAEELLKNASVEERAEIEKIASVHHAVLGKITDPFTKSAYQQGAMDAAFMLDAIAGNVKYAGMPDPTGGAGGPPPGADPTGGAGAPPGAPGEGPGAPMIPGGEQGPADIQQIAQLLMAAVQSGEIDQQTAEAIMQTLAQGEQGGGAGAPPGADPAAGAPDPSAGGGEPQPGETPDDANMPPEAKAASVLYRKLVKAA